MCLVLSFLSCVCLAVFHQHSQAFFSRVLPGLAAPRRDYRAEGVVARAVYDVHLQERRDTQGKCGWEEKGRVGGVPEEEEEEELTNSRDQQASRKNTHMADCIQSNRHRRPAIPDQQSQDAQTASGTGSLPLHTRQHHTSPITTRHCCLARCDHICTLAIPEALGSPLSGRQHQMAHRGRCTDSKRQNTSGAYSAMGDNISHHQ